MTSPAAPHDDAPHDEHLRAALCHAPDRDVQPSEALNARILRRAHEAAGTAAPAPGRARSAGWRGRLSALLGGLLRPGPSAAFASLALATVIGVMWRDGPPPERDAGDRVAPTVSSQLLRPGAAASEVAAAALSQRSAPPRSDDALGRRPMPSAGAEALPAARPPAAPRPAAPARAEAQAPAPAEAAVQAKADAAARARSDAAAPLDRRADASPAARLAAPAAGPEAAAPAEPAPAAIAGARAMPADPLAPLAAAWAGTGTDVATALDTLRQLTRGRWQRAPADALPPEAEAVGGVTGPGGEPQGVLHLSDDRVWWRPAGPDASVWQAPLPPGAAAPLRASLGPARAAGPSRP